MKKRTNASSAHFHRSKVKLLSLISAMCLVGLLVFPSMALAAAASVSGTGVNSARNSREVTWQNNGTRRVGGEARGVNNHGVNTMRIRVEGRRAGITVGSQSAIVQPLRTGRTATQLGCHLLWAHQWRVRIENVNNRLWTGSATLHRVQ